jgi:hypothetical protein
MNPVLKQFQPDTKGSGVSGIVQVYHNGQWGTVCHDGWYMEEAKVACRQLGFTKAVGYWHLGRGTGKVWLNGMGCTGTETSLESCSHSAWGGVSSACRTNQYDAGVVCSGYCLYDKYLIIRTIFGYIHDRNIDYISWCHV